MRHEESNIGLGGEKIGQCIGYGAAAGVKTVGLLIGGLARGVKKGAKEGIASSPNVPLGPAHAAGQAVGNFFGDIKRGWQQKGDEMADRQAEARCRRSAYDTRVESTDPQ